MGAGTVAAMAVAVPARTGALVLVSGALEDQRGLSSVLLGFPPFVRWLQVYLERCLLTEERVASILATAANEEPGTQQVLAYHAPLAFEGTARALTTMAKSSDSLPLVRLEELDMPVAAIWGDLDTVVPLESFARIALHIPHVRLYVLEGAGHLPMETDPVRFNAALLDFLRNHRVDTRAE
jgi:pimeloyl-ACP methyl ester carboxylesterase